MREAIIDLTDRELEAMGYGELISMCRAAGIREVELLEDGGRGGVPQIALGDRLDEERLDALDCVDDWEYIGETDGTHRYVLEVTALEMPERAAEDHDDLVGPCDPTVTDRGLLLSLVGSQDTIRAMLRNFEEAGVTPELRALGEYDGGEHSLEGLTERQLEVLRTAYDMGFYEIPRETTTDEIAMELGIDAATVSDHLQRAERNLLAGQLPT